MSHNSFFATRRKMLKVFMNNKKYITQMVSVLDMVGKRRKFCLLAFFPFPMMFSKALVLWVVKTWNCMVQYKPITTQYHILTH